MRNFFLLVTLILLPIGAANLSAEEGKNIQLAADEKAAAAANPRTCSANSADRTQSCSVTCPEGKTATCVGGAQGAKDVDCTCK